tara:strand:+ start:257 stop:637 length:381 start_codon:yes stop_codon:yes gene_type:complete
MIEARTPGEETQKNETPNTITVSMILEDLDNGIDRNGIKDKYGLQAWEVKQMFEHPTLKGKKAKKVRKLSFNFVDDTAVDPNQTSIPVETAPDVDVHTEASMTVEATPELQEEDPFIGEFGQEDEF